MKYTIRQIAEGEDELILNYVTVTDEVQRILDLINGEQTRLTGWRDKQMVLIEPSDILYLESVDGRTYAYTDEEVLRMDDTLNRLEELLRGINFFRCSKSMILNIDKVAGLRSLPSNRIDATMKNGEHVMIARTFASDFRKRIRGGGRNE